MRFPISFAFALLLALSGCSNKSGGDSQPKLVSTGIPGLKFGITLSSNTVGVGGNVSITAKLVNGGKSDQSIDLNGLTAWLSVTGPDGKPIKEIPFIDKIGVPGKPQPLVIPAGGSQDIRVFGAEATNGRWKGFGSPKEYAGVGLVVQRDAGASCYPLEVIPGKYSLRCHLRIKASRANAPAEEVTSDKMTLSVTK